MISPQAYALAKQHLQGVPESQLMGALGNALNADPTVPLVQLIAAHKILTQEQRKQQAMQAMQMAQQGAGTPGQPPQQETVAQQVANRLAALNREGGIAELPTGHLGENYATGGIVAFAEGKEVEGDEFSKLRPEEGATLTPSFPELVEKGIISLGAGARSMYTNPNANYQLLGRAEAPSTGTEKGTTGTSTFPGRSRVEGASTISAQPGLPSATPAARAATAATAGIRDSVSTPAIDRARGSIAELQRRSQQGLADLDNPERDPITGEPIPKKTLASIAAEQDAERKKALKEAGLPEQGYKERIDQLASEAKQAKDDRDTDRWLAVAQGFFAMGAGKSPYAMQNMAEGFGITTKQLGEAEKEYRKGEKARQDSIATLKQAQRAEVLGNQKEAANSYEKVQELQQKERDAKRKSYEHMGLLAVTQESTLATKEASLANTKAMKEASMAQTAALTGARAEETKRYHDAQRQARLDQLFVNAQAKHPQYKALQMLGQEIAEASGNPNLPPDQKKILQQKINTYNNMQNNIHEWAWNAAHSDLSRGDIFSAADNIISGKR